MARHKIAFGNNSILIYTDECKIYEGVESLGITCIVFQAEMHAPELDIKEIIRMKVDRRIFLLINNQCKPNLVKAGI